MTTPDELRDRIARIDPARDVPTEPITGARARTLLEDIMKTPIHLDADDRSDSDGGTTPPSDVGPAHSRSPRRWWLGAGAAAAVVALAVAGAAIGGVFDGSSTPAQAGPPLQLSTGEAGVSTSTCMQITPEIVAQVPLAFAGTATAVDGEMVTLDVTKWYVGGDAAAVQLSAPDGMQGLTGGIDFQTGQQYLISAYDGVVNYCGMSGAATPELQSIYDAAFPG